MEEGNDRGRGVLNVHGRPLGVRRLTVYAAGIFCVSLGIVLCKKCALGISPISCIPLVLSCVLPLSFGMFTTLFHLVNTVIQMTISRTVRDPFLWAQVALAFVFGWVIDGLNAVLVIDSSSVAWQIIALVGSVVFTALGMVLMIDMDLVQNPPDGAVKQISEALGAVFGNVKIGYDVSCVVLAALIGLVFLGRLEGLGIATIVSALLVGKTVEWIRLIKQGIRSKLVHAAS